MAKVNLEKEIPIPKTKVNLEKEIPIPKAKATLEKEIPIPKAKATLEKENQNQQNQVKDPPIVPLRRLLQL